MAVTPLCKKSSFRRQRFTIFLSITIGWSFYYLCQRTVPAATSALRAKGFTKDDYGLITSSFAVAYAISIFISGLLSDRVSSKVIFCFGLALSGLFCALLPLTDSALLCCVIWFLEGLFQGCGWPACTAVLRRLYSTSELGTWWSIASGSGNMGAFLAPILVTYISDVFNWQLSFYIIGGAAFSLAILLSLTSFETQPDIYKSSTSFPTSNCTSNSKQEMKSSQSNSSSVQKPKWYAVFSYSNLWLIAGVYIIFWVVKAAVGDWIQMYYEEVAGRSGTAAAGCVGVMYIGGVLGKLTLGPLSDLLLQARTTGRSICPRAPVILVLSLLTMACLQMCVTHVTKESSELWLSSLSFTMGFVVEGGVSMVSLSSVEAVPRNLSGSALGMTLSVALLVGRTTGGLPFGYAVRRWGWAAAYQALEVSCLLAVGIASYLALAPPRKKKAE